MDSGYFRVDTGAIQEYSLQCSISTYADPYPLQRRRYLASALDVLSVSGCNWFCAEILEMLAVIAGRSRCWRSSAAELLVEPQRVGPRAETRLPAAGANGRGVILLVCSGNRLRRRWRPANPRGVPPCRGRLSEQPIPPSRERPAAPASSSCGLAPGPPRGRATCRARPMTAPHCAPTAPTRPSRGSAMRPCSSSFRDRTCSRTPIGARAPAPCHGRDRNVSSRRVWPSRACHPFTWY